MVSCAAPGCSNRGEKGYCMKSFPRDPVVRRSWQLNVNRDGWEPTNNSKLCEIHFLPEMWEKPRVDGKKKLKWNAIPTIFPHNTNAKTKTDKTEKKETVFLITQSNYCQTVETLGEDVYTTDPLAINESTSDVKVAPTIPTNSFISPSTVVSNLPSKIILNVENPSDFHNYAQPIEYVSKTHKEVQVNCESSPTVNTVTSSSSLFSESYVSDVNIPGTLDNSDLFKKIYQYQKSYTQLLAKVCSYKAQLRSLKIRNDRLVKIARKDRHLRLLKHVFNDDQIAALERTNCKFMKWSHATLINALRLKNYCGKDGYEEILRQKIPLPSIRTLNRIKITDTINTMAGTKQLRRPQY